MMNKREIDNVLPEQKQDSEQMIVLPSPAPILQTGCCVQPLRVLVACEESQTVAIAFRKLGHEAFSCDIQDCSGGHPEWHIKGDAILEAYSGNYDLMIAHPPCTFLTITANRSFVNNPDRWEKRLDAMKFVYKLMNAPINKIAIENPVGVISTHIRPPDQYIEPFEYGFPETKKTGIWLKNLPLLKPTNIVEPKFILCSKGKKYSPTHWKYSSTNNPENAKIRSKTYYGIAEAMATQWGVL